MDDDLSGRGVRLEVGGGYGDVLVDDAGVWPEFSYGGEKGRRV